MSFNPEQAKKCAETMKTEVARLLDAALKHEQEFACSIEAGLVDGPPLEDSNGVPWRNPLFDGSSELRIKIAPCQQLPGNDYFDGVGSNQ